MRMQWKSTFYQATLRSKRVAKWKFEDFCSTVYNPVNDIHSLYFRHWIEAPWQEHQQCAVLHERETERTVGTADLHKDSFLSNMSRKKQCGDLNFWWWDSGALLMMQCVWCVSKRGAALRGDAELPTATDVQVGTSHGSLFHRSVNG